MTFRTASKSLVTQDQGSDTSYIDALRESHPQHSHYLTPTSYEGINDCYSTLNDAMEMRAVALWIRLKLNSDPLPILWWLFNKAYIRECVRVGIPVSDSMQFMQESTFLEQTASELHDETIRANRALSDLFGNFDFAIPQRFEKVNPHGEELAREFVDEITARNIQEELAKVAPRLREVFHAILNEGSTSVSLEL